MIYILAIMLSAFLYRAGGASWGHTKWRDFGCPAVFMGYMSYSFGWHWLLIITGIVMFMALCTYWDSVFGYDNFYMHGFAVGASTVALAWANQTWVEIAAYSIILALVMGILNWIVNKYHVPFSDWIEELSRGAIIIAATKVFLIFT